MIAVGYMLALLFAAVSMNIFIHVPTWALIVGPLIFVVPVIVTVSRASAGPADRSEITPDEAWKGGIIYYNPDDPALFVPKRFGVGYTLNFGNRWSWLVVLGVVLIAVAAPLLSS